MAILFESEDEKLHYNNDDMEEELALDNFDINQGIISLRNDQQFLSNLTNESTIQESH